MRPALAPGFGNDAGGGPAVGRCDRPPAGVDSSDAPLGQPAPVVGESASYAFIQLQPGDDAPVAYDPCRPDPRGGERPHRAARRRDLGGRRARRHHRGRRGCSSSSTARPTRVPTAARDAYLPDRYPGRWAPVLIAWSDPQETAALEGTIAGQGGSSWLETDEGSVYVSGAIELDGPQLAQIAAGALGDGAARAVIEHELGHVVGLDHVDDPTPADEPERRRQRHPVRPR